MFVVRRLGVTPTRFTLKDINLENLKKHVQEWNIISPDTEWEGE